MARNSACGTMLCRTPHLHATDASASSRSSRGMEFARGRSLLLLQKPARTVRLKTDTPSRSAARSASAHTASNTLCVVTCAAETWRAHSSTRCATVSSTAAAQTAAVTQTPPTHTRPWLCSTARDSPGPVCCVVARTARTARSENARPDLSCCAGQSSKADVRSQCDSASDVRAAARSKSG
eukprot:3931604-Rhodomonas_salina.2